MECLCGFHVVFISGTDRVYMNMCGKKVAWALA